MENLSGKMLAYMNEQQDSLEKSGGNPEQDLKRLRQVFKGVLALNDYFEVLQKNTSLLMELQTVFQDNKSNSYTSLFSWSIFAQLPGFSTKTTYENRFKKGGS